MQRSQVNSAVIFIAAMTSFGCSQERIEYYPNRQAAGESCLEQLDKWIKTDLQKPPLDIHQEQKEWSLLKNANGQFNVLDSFCKPTFNEGDKIAEMRPIVNYLRIPVEGEGEHTLESLTPFFTDENGRNFTYPLSK